MDTALVNALMSVVRSLLITGGAVLVTKGYLDEETNNTLIGAFMVIIPALMGVWQKYSSERKTQDREALALNVGIVVADNTIGPTPSVRASEVPAVLEKMEDSVLMPLNPDVSPLVLPPKPTEAPS